MDVANIILAMNKQKAHKSRVPARKDQVNFNVNGPGYPDLMDEFIACLALYGGDRSAVLRELVGAWCRGTRKLNAPPRFPLTVIQAEEKNHTPKKK